jgi:hypothetical protein
MPGYRDWCNQAMPPQQGGQPQEQGPVPDPVSSIAARLWRGAALAFALAGNLVPLMGVLSWGWDTFQLLMLYWTETVIVWFWTLMRLARLPAGEAGEMTVNGKVTPATNSMLVGFFSLHAGVFILVHLVFLWVLFSGEWLRKVRGGSASFVGELFLGNGIWAALLMFFVAGAIGFLVDTRTRLAATVEEKLGSARLTARAREKSDRVGAVVGALYVRIVIMQVAIIFGAWFADAVGSLAPLLLVIALKTLVDLALGTGIPAFKGFSFSTGGSTVES